MNSFIEEIKEDIRFEKIIGFLHTYKHQVVMGVIALVIIMAGGFYWHYMMEQKKEEVAQNYYNAIVIANEGRLEDAFDVLSKIKNDKTYGVFSQFFKASALSKDPVNSSEVEEIYESLSKNYTIDSNFRDLATIKLVLFKFNKADPKELESLLRNITKSASAWRTVAKELLGVLLQKTGNEEEAKTIYQELYQDASASQGIKARAKAFADLLNK